MNDVEQRLRHTLHHLADSVPPSEAPRSEFTRRLAHRRGRGPALVVAAAAAVVAVAGAAALVVDRDPAGPPAAGHEVGGEEDGMVWSWEYERFDVETGPFVVGTFTRNGTRIDAVVWVRVDQLCVAEGHHVGNGEPGALVGTSCVAVPDWQGGPGEHTYVATSSVLPTGTPDSGPLPGLLLFMTAPEVEAIEVRAGDSTPVAVRELGHTDDVRLFLADFKTSTQGFGYTARDASGAVVEEAIT